MTSVPLRTTPWQALGWLVLGPPSPPTGKEKKKAPWRRGFEASLVRSACWMITIFFGAALFWIMVPASSHPNTLPSFKNMSSVLSKGEVAFVISALSSPSLLPENPAPPDEMKERERHVPFSLALVHEDPQVTQYIAAHIEAMGLRLVSPECEGCLVLTWTGKSWLGRPVPGEHLSAEVFVEKRGDVMSLLSYSVLRARAHDTPSRPALTLRESSQRLEIGAAVETGFFVLLHLMLLSFAWLMGVGGGGGVGLWWESKRRHGLLDHLVLAHHPPWVTYGALILGTSLYLLEMGVGLLCGLLLIGLPLKASFAFTLVPVMVSLFIVSSLWGVLITMLFHHPQGRKFAQIVLSPFTLLIAWFFRLLFLWFALKVSSPLLAQRQFLELLDAWPWFLVAPFPLLGIGLVLWWCIEQRIGLRREGLRETKTA